MIGALSFFAAACNVSGPLDFPTWYTYLPCASNGQPELNAILDIWLILAAIIEILLRIAALLAVGYVIYGGIQFITSQGEPEKIAHARGTVLNAIIGLIIAVISAAVVSYIASQFN